MLRSHFEIMGVTTADLFRNGNAAHARLTDLRLPSTHPADPDVDTYVNPTSKDEWVSATNGKGASCWNAKDSGWRKPWRLPANTVYPDCLRPWNDDVPPGHWSWAPAYDMPLADFIAALDVVNKQFLTA
jgi:hypothetical protein